MQVSIRAVFAALLWLLATIPPVLLAVHLGSPVAAVRLALGIEAALRWTVVAAAGILGAVLVLYPPFLPGVRLAFRRLKGRLGTDLAPLREAQARLQHFETAADHLAAGRVLLAQGDAPGSVRHLARAVELDPAHPASRYQLGLALGRAGDPQGAAQQLARAVELDPSHAFGAAMLELGVALERLRDDPLAVEVLAGHEREFGPQRRNQYHRARALARLGRREDAVAALREAARPFEQGKMTLEDELYRARARVGLMRGGRP